jgi:hypothetical protein
MLPFLTLFFKSKQHRAISDCVLPAVDDGIPSPAANTAHNLIKGDRAIIDLSIVLVLVGVLLIPGYFFWLLLSRDWRPQMSHDRLIPAERAFRTDVGGAPSDGIAHQLDDMHGEAGFSPVGEPSFIDADVSITLIAGETSRRAVTDVSEHRRLN